MIPEKKPRLVGWFVFGTLAGLTFGCFTSVLFYGFWDSIVPPPGRQNRRFSYAESTCRHASKKLTERKRTVDPRYGGEPETQRGFWHDEYIGHHYAVIPIVGYHQGEGAELYAITNHPGYPTLRYRFVPGGSEYDVALIGPDGYEVKR